MFPGVILQMTYWYRPDEMSIRLLYFCEQLNLISFMTVRLTLLQTSSATYLEYSAAFSLLPLTQFLGPRDSLAGNGKRLLYH